jgi:methylated-DNA-[protein]-cysteine S-methyltransferase
LRRRVPDAQFSPSAFPRAREALRRYFQGEPALFREKMQLQAGFTKCVLEAVRRIPYGRTRTYGDLARAVGKPGASRAVGRALGTNPLLIIIPCHRVVRSGGDLGGYSGSGGINFKRKLLAMEQAIEKKA